MNRNPGSLHLDPVTARENSIAFTRRERFTSYTHTRIQFTGFPQLADKLCIHVADEFEEIMRQVFLPKDEPIDSRRVCWLQQTI
jgi:hypothetical protein